MMLILVFFFCIRVPGCCAHRRRTQYRIPYNRDRNINIGLTTTHAPSDSGRPRKICAARCWVSARTHAQTLCTALARAFWPPQIKLVIYLFGWAQLARARSILMHCMFCGSRRVSRCWVFFSGLGERGGWGGGGCARTEFIVVANIRPASRR